jgi:hypothetical protein
MLLALAVIDSAAPVSPALLPMQHQTNAGTSKQACSGQPPAVARQTEPKRTLSFLDAQTGEPRDVEVLWCSAHALLLNIDNGQLRRVMQPPPAESLNQVVR